MKKWIVLSIILAILIGGGIVYSENLMPQAFDQLRRMGDSQQQQQNQNCFTCPYCRQSGWRIGQQWVGGKTVYVYQCANDHVWQCAW